MRFQRGRVWGMAAVLMLLAGGCCTHDVLLSSDASAMAAYLRGHHGVSDELVLTQAVRIGIQEHAKWRGSDMELSGAAEGYISSMGAKGVAEVFRQIEGCSGPQVNAGLNLLAKVICLIQSPTYSQLVPTHGEDAGLKTWYRWQRSDGSVVDIPAFVPFCAAHKPECDEAIAQWKRFAAAEGIVVK